MTEAELVLQETNCERSIIKKSAYHKKGGSKSKKCSLPSDFLSKKEKESMNGPCRRWILSDIYSYEEFKSMPQYVQIEYVNYYIDKFHVGLSAVSELIFGKGKSYLHNYFRHHEMIKEVHTQKKSFHQSKEDRKNFLDYVIQHKLCKPGEDPAPAEKEKISIPVTTVKEEPKIDTKSAEPIYEPESTYDTSCPYIRNRDEITTEETEKPTELFTVFSMQYVGRKIDIESLKMLEKMMSGRIFKVTLTIETL